MNDTPFFIIANPRSGSSMLRLMLNRHPGVVVPPECGYITWLYEKYKNFGCAGADNSLSEFIEDVVSSKKFETWDVSATELLRFVDESSPRDYQDLCRLVHQYYAYQTGKKIQRWGDKNNYYVSSMDQILEIFPLAEFVYLIRDPRDVYASYKDLRKLETKSKYAPKLKLGLDEFIHEWSLNLMNMKAIAERVGEDRYFYVLYEEIVGSVDESICMVLSKLDLNYHENVVKLEKPASKYEQEPEGTVDWKRLTKKPVTSSRVGRHVSVLSEYEASRIYETCCKAAANVLGSKIQERWVGI